MAALMKARPWTPPSPGWGRSRAWWQPHTPVATTLNTWHPVANMWLPQQELRCPPHLAGVEDFGVHGVLISVAVEQQFVEEPRRPLRLMGKVLLGVLILYRRKFIAYAALDEVGWVCLCWRHLLMCDGFTLPELHSQRAFVLARWCKVVMLVGRYHRRLKILRYDSCEASLRRSIYPMSDCRGD